MSLVKLIDFNLLGDERGHLTVLEANKNIPFDIKRVYYLTGTKPGVARGFHAHRRLEQISVCVAGKCRMLLDDGTDKEDVWLDSPTKAIRIEKMVWHEMHDFSEDCVLLVLASDHYDELDYIRVYNNFINYKKTQLVNYDRQFLDLSWDWLNDPEIKSLTMTPDFTRAQQFEFYNSLCDREDYKIYGVVFEGAPIGACGLKNIKSDVAEVWLYIGEKKCWGKGVGEVILDRLEKKASALFLKKLYLKVLKSNHVAKKLYIKYGYLEVGGGAGNYHVMEKSLESERLKI